MDYFEPNMNNLYTILVSLYRCLVLFTAVLRIRIQRIRIILADPDPSYFSWIRIRIQIQI